MQLHCSYIESALKWSVLTLRDYCTPISKAGVHTLCSACQLVLKQLCQHDTHRMGQVQGGMDGACSSPGEVVSVMKSISWKPMLQ